MANLYELNQNYNNLLDVLETADNDSLKEMIDIALNSVEEDIKTKVDNTVRVLKNFDADIEALKNEEKALVAKRKAIENQKARLQTYLFDFTRATEGKKLKGSIFELSVKKNPPSVVIEDNKYVPVEFITEEVVIKVDKTGLKKYLKDNVIEGCRLEQGESLKIK